MRKVRNAVFVAFVALMGACDTEVINPANEDSISIHPLESKNRFDDLTSAKDGATNPPWEVSSRQLGDVECYPGRRTLYIAGNLGRSYMGWCIAFDPRPRFYYEGIPSWSVNSYGSNRISYQVRPARTIHIYARGPLRCGWTNVVVTATDSRSITSNLEFEIAPRNRIREDCEE